MYLSFISFTTFAATNAIDLCVKISEETSNVEDKVYKQLSQPRIVRIRKLQYKTKYQMRIKQKATLHNARTHYVVTQCIHHTLVT